jgi:hypothetical protein
MITMRIVSPAVDPSLNITDGEAPFTVGDETFHTYYKIIGNRHTATQRPLIAIHGGPGTSMLPGKSRTL